MFPSMLLLEILLSTSPCHCFSFGYWHGVLASANDYRDGDTIYIDIDLEIDLDIDISLVQQ